MRIFVLENLVFLIMEVFGFGCNGVGMFKLDGFLRGSYFYGRCSFFFIRVRIREGFFFLFVVEFRGGSFCYLRNSRFEF